MRKTTKEVILSIFAGFFILAVLSTASCGATEQSFSLSQGWNFIAFPMLPSNPAPIASVLKDVSPEVRIVWGYDNVNKAWLKWTPSTLCPLPSALCSVEFGKGYWVSMYNPGAISLISWFPSFLSTVHLSSGWNLVGYNGADGKASDTALSGIADKWSILWNWTNSRWSIKRPSSASSLLPSILTPFPEITAFNQGKAYWIRAKEETDWVTGSDPQPLGLTILAMNDTHSFAEPFSSSVVIDASSTSITLGGYTRLKSALDDVRSREQNTLTLHAGDAVTGTLYFTKFQGDSDFDFLNFFGVEAMTFGNHEFDKGPALINRFIKTATFPILSANVDFSREPAVVNKPHPYLIKYYSNEPVAIIGVTTAITAGTSSPGPNIVFNDVTDSVAKTVTGLTSAGINKVVVLSHIGFEEDKKLAQSVPGIDVIIGGHSHSLLADASAVSSLKLPVNPPDDVQGTYPVVVKSPEGKDVLVTQAWRYGGVLGTLKVSFNRSGEITGFTGRPILVVGDSFKQNRVEVPPGSDIYNRIVQVVNSSSAARVYGENTEAKAKLAPYTAQVIDFRTQKVADASADIKRAFPPLTDLNAGPGPLIADSMLWKMKTLEKGGDMAIISRGAVKGDFKQGTITYGDVYTCLPYGGTYYIIELKGSDVKNALEDGVDFQLVNNIPAERDWMPFVSGMRYTVNRNITVPKGSRITVLQIKNADGSYSDINPAGSYRVATNAFMANGGDGYLTFKNADPAAKYDTGFVDAEVLVEFFKSLGTLNPPAEQRIIDATTAAAVIYLRGFAGGVGSRPPVHVPEWEYRMAA